MNYYAIWVRYKEGHNEFYDPAVKKFFRPKKIGEKMESRLFFFLDDLMLHQRIVEKMFCGICHGDIQLHLSEIRPCDPDYLEISNYFEKRKP